MIIDRTRLKKMAVYAGVVLLLIWGAYSFVRGNGQEGEAKVQNTNTSARPGPARSSNASEFCARYRMEREQVRSREVSILNGVVKEGNGDSQARSKAMQRLVQISSDIEHEMKAENLVRCHGARDCVALLEPDITTMIIASPPMNEKQLTDIKSELGRMMGCEEGSINLVFRDK